MCVIYHACHKQVRSSLFIWEGSESRKPSCRSSCCCLRSLHLNLLGIFVRCDSEAGLLTSEIRAKASTEDLRSLKTRERLTPQPQLLRLPTSGPGGFRQKQLSPFPSSSAPHCLICNKTHSFQLRPGQIRAIRTKP